MGFEHRCAHLLELQKQRRPVAGFEQHNQATGANTAHADDFLSDVDQRESIDVQRAGSNNGLRHLFEYQQ